MVVGPSGTGKTLLCQVLAEELCDKFDVVLLCSGRLSTRSALFQSILYELGRPYRQMDEGELRIALTDYLLSNNTEAAGEGKQDSLVLLVDEAHTLPLRLLEEIRMLTNLTRQGHPLVRLVLCGGSILEERFASPRLESFSQRLVARCYLESFNRAETQEYLRRRIDAVAGQGCVGGELFFDAKTAQAVYQATDGVPRLINQVCDHALLMVYSAGGKQLRPRDIEEAWADLQQLPTPWSDEDADDGRECSSDGQQSGGRGIVEFGGLDDDDDFGGDDSDEQCESPALHIAATGDTSDEDNIVPVARIEQTLSDLDEGFEPAGAIVPEVVLTFGELGNPFEEKFEEEEVVARRYEETTHNETPYNETPSGISAKQKDQPAAEETVAGAASCEVRDCEAGAEESRSQRCRPCISSLVGGSPLTLPIRRDRGAEEKASEPVESGTAEVFADADVILIDAEHEQSRDRSHRIAVARNNQYNQLFAKLRRG